MFYENVRASARKLETDDLKLLGKRKLSIHYEKGKAPIEFLSTAEEH